MRLCRACFTGDAGASASGVLQIVESEQVAKPVVVNESGPKPEFFSEPSRVDKLNVITQAVFEQNPSLGTFLGEPKFEFTFSGWRQPEVAAYSGLGGPIKGRMLPGGKIALDEPIMRLNGDGSIDLIDVVDQEVFLPGAAFQPQNSQRIEVEVKGLEIEDPAPPTQSPHRAMLEPKRKIRIPK